jgi:hypothetical protein
MDHHSCLRRPLSCWRAALLAVLGVANGTGCGGKSQRDDHVCQNPTPFQAGLNLLADVGFVQCDGGWLHRPAAVTCPSLLPREGLDIEESLDPVFCTADADCSERANGHCEPILGCPGGSDSPPRPDGYYCEYGCTQDSDCDDGMLCLCGEPAGRCVPAKCSVDADCASGLCAGTAQQSSYSHSFACVVAGDECLSWSDCEQGRCFVGAANRECSFTVDCGRPFLIAGVPRTAIPRARQVGPAAWGMRRSPNTAGLDRWQLDRLAEHWTRLALMEHASIAAFSRFTLDLLALGAPPVLIRDAQRALADEIHHAEICFGLASAYAGRPVEPGPLPIDGAVVEHSTAEIVTNAFIESCVGETIAAVEARTLLDYVQDAEVREALERIATDEARHAELGWRFLKWACDSLPAGILHAVRTDISRILEREARYDTPRPQAPTAECVMLLGLGVGNTRFHRDVRRRALTEVIEPCARALRLTSSTSDSLLATQWSPAAGAFCT